MCIYFPSPVVPASSPPPSPTPSAVSLCPGSQLLFQPSTSSQGLLPLLSVVFSVLQVTAILNGISFISSSLFPPLSKVLFIISLCPSPRFFFHEPWISLKFPFGEVQPSFSISYSGSFHPNLGFHHHLEGLYQCLYWHLWRFFWLFLNSSLNSELPLLLFSGD